MVKRVIHILLFMVVVLRTSAQTSNVDSLKHAVAISDNDTINLILLGKISADYTETNPDSAGHYAEKMLPIARKLGLRLEEVHALGELGYAQLNMGNYPRSLQTLLSAIAIGEDPKSEKNILPAGYMAIDEFSNRSGPPAEQRFLKLSRIYQYAGILYGNYNNYEKALTHYFKARELSEKSRNEYMLCIVDLTLGRAYLALKKIDSALITEQRAYDISMRIGYKRYLGSILLNLGRIQLAMGNAALAKGYFGRAIDVSMEQNYLRGVAAGELLLADLYKQSGNIDSGLYYANAAMKVGNDLNNPGLKLRSYTSLAGIYTAIDNKDSTVKYQELIIKINDSLFNSKQAQQFENIDFDERERHQEIQAAKKAYQNRQQKYLLLAGLAAFLIIVIILWRNNLHRQKTNTLLQRQKNEIEATLAELKSAQAQLIQSEKMASLGELTAGIAHEIQNPLNFINNFSEVNSDLIGEMNQELEKGNVENARTLANDISENEQKIVVHGKRAAAIVKGMLQHSRSSSGVKEPTDINALADEYLRLAFHGLRAKDKSFNATLKTDFDVSIGKINIIPQEIGRVILNLITNAFYAVTEKKRQRGSEYDPTVSVTTKKNGNKLEVRVKDNGNGIPQKAMDKIFQPFFTTKPTGQGTGLGLSLSYDIVKAHGGELKAETKEGEGVEFVIYLPV